MDHSNWNGLKKNTNQFIGDRVSFKQYVNFTANHNTNVKLDPKANNIPLINNLFGNDITDYILLI